MISLSCIAIVTLTANISAASTDDTTYEAALRRSVNSGRPLVVFVTADWCAACKRMKASTLRPMEVRGQLRNVEFTVVDVDKRRDLAKQLVQGGPIPQLVRYDRGSGTWQVRRLVGAQNIKEVARFIQYLPKGTQTQQPRMTRPITPNKNR